MEFEFDKEMDAILRKARGTEAAAFFDAHLDADQISAFAENALPEKARRRSVEHLAECARCRGILSNVVALNAEAEPETASSTVTPKEIAAVPVPWYRRLFAFPQLAYTMGALVLLFSGFFGYVALQNLSSGSRDVSYSKTPSEPATKSAPAANAPAVSVANKPTENVAAANTAPANSASSPAATPGVSMPPAEPERGPMNKDREAVPTERKSDITTGEGQTSAAPAPITEEDTKTADKTAEEGNIIRQQNTDEAPKPSSTTTGAVPKPDLSKKEAQTRDERFGGDDQPKLKTRSVPEKNAGAQPVPGTTRSVGGKTFNNVGGTWFDSAYTNQKQKTVNRGTDEYRKLDSGLRAIGDELGGTVIVLWKSKAYRIQ
ncbi:MAG: hypothetical protein JSS81_04425 [Acidobacteria bacterium]|nr:hypothetical protein [Acidobacteriota bacterium]